MSSPCPTGCDGQFQEGDWTGSFKSYSVERVPTAERLFDGSKLVLAAPETFIDEDECALLAGDRLQSRNDPHVVALIEAEAVTRFQIPTQVFGALGLSTLTPGAGPTLVRLRRWVIQCLESPIFVLKERYNRARPWRCCGADAIKPMFEQPHRYHPGHPSYPSGHSTVAHTFSYLLAFRYPDKSAAMEMAADAIAKRREIAGLHFPSDSKAGKSLAAQCAALMLSPAENTNHGRLTQLLNDLPDVD